MNWDRDHAMDPKLYTLSSPDIASYNRGAWLGAPVRSVDLSGPKVRDDLQCVAEMVPRLEVLDERMHEEAG